MNAIVSHRKDRRYRAAMMAKGASSITLDHRIRPVERDDLDALLRDWERIGVDMRQAISKARRERAYG